MLNWWLREWPPQRIKSLKTHWQFWVSEIFPLIDSDRTRALDVGCGIYGIVNVLPEDVWPRAGCDPLLSELKHVFEFDYSVTWRSDRAECIGYQNSSFGIVMCLTVLEHVDNPKKAIREMARVSDKWVIIASNTYSGYWWWARWVSHALRISSPAEKHFFSDKHLEAIFSQNKLQVVKVWRNSLVDGAIATGPTDGVLEGIAAMANTHGAFEGFKYMVSRCIGARAYKGDTLWLMKKISR